jgi:hypothetical protein
MDSAPRGATIKEGNIMPNKVITKREDLNYDSPDYFIDLVRVEYYEAQQKEKPFIQQLMAIIPGDKEEVKTPVPNHYNVIEKTYKNTIVSDFTQDIILDKVPANGWQYNDDKGFRMHLTDMACPACGQTLHVKKWENGSVKISCHNGWLASKCKHYVYIK